MNKGYKFSKETKQKMRLAKLGKKHTEEHNRKIGLIHKGKITSEETKKKMSEAVKGKPQPWNQKENHWNWKGGISPESEIIRSSIENRLWREAVFARDNWTCQKCGARSGNGKAIMLNPHHIKNFAQYSKLRFAIDNGITFCEKCHKEFHKKYGRKNNTKRQIEEYIN